MKKKLVIKFWKAERALAMQIVEQYGLPEEKDEGIVRIVKSPELTDDNVYLRSSIRFDFDIAQALFVSNQDRDRYIVKILQAITDELFCGTGELKVGEMCEARNYNDWEKLKLLAILPNPQKCKYICEASYDDTFCHSYIEARPLGKRTEPKVETNGEIITYTWEEE